MFLGIGWLEIAVILAVALLVVGPKQMPVVARKFGEVVGQGLRMWKAFKDDIK